MPFTLLMIAATVVVAFGINSRPYADDWDKWASICLVTWAIWGAIDAAKRLKVARLALVAVLVLVAARAEAQTSVNLASNTSSFVIGSSPSPAALGEVTYNLAWTFPGASEPISFAVSGITSTTSFNMTADNASSYGLDWANLLDSFANHHPGFGNISPGPTVSIETDLGEFDEPGCCGHWNFIRSTTGDGSTAQMVPTRLLVQISSFWQSPVDQATIFTAVTSLRGMAYLAPEPSAFAMLLPVFGLLVRRRYHG